MAEKIKGITVQIGGDTEPLNKALSKVNTQTKSLQTELTGVTSLLKLDPTNTALLAQKQELLSQSVEKTQEKLIALKEAKKLTDEEMQNGTKINQEQYRNLTREIASTENKLKGLEEQTKSFGNIAEQQLKSVADKFGKVGDKISGAGKAFAPISAAATGAVAGMVGMAINAGKAADDINTLSKQTGLSTAEIQKFQYAADIIDVPLETLTGSMAKLTKNMASAQNGSKNVQAAFDVLTVSITNSDGSLRNNQDVFAETIAKLGEMQNGAERDALAMQIFGKSAQDLNPLILGGADALATLGLEAQNMGLILSQDALDGANAFNDELDRTKAQLGSSFALLGAEIGTLLLPILQELVSSIGTVIEKIGTMDSGTLKAILTIIGLVAGIAPLLIILGSIIGSLKNIIGIIPVVINCAKALWAVLAANPLVAIIGLIAGLITWLITAYNTSDTFRAKVDACFNAIKETVSAVVAAISDKISQFVSIGINMVKGLWEGIKSAAAWLSGKVQEWCANLVGGIKSFFGIHSPSTLFRDQIGKNIVLGISEGIDDNGKVAINSMSELSKYILSEATSWVDDKKFYNQISLKDELEFWQDLINIGEIKSEGKSEIEKKIYSINQSIAENEKRAINEYTKSIESRAAALNSFAGTFDAISNDTYASGQQLIANLQDQISVFKRWQAGLGDLKERGIGGAMFDELKEMGPKAINEIEALVRLSDAELAQYASLYAEKMTLATQQAINEIGEVSLPMGNISAALSDLTLGANYAVSPINNFVQEAPVSPYEQVANMFAAALLEGLNYVGNSIFDAIPKKADFNVNGKHMAEATWSDYQSTGAQHGRMFAPSREEIVDIAMSVAPQPI